MAKPNEPARVTLKGYPMLATHAVAGIRAGSDNVWSMMMGSWNNVGNNKTRWIYWLIRDDEWCTYKEINVEARCLP